MARCLHCWAGWLGDRVENSLTSGCLESSSVCRGMFFMSRQRFCVSREQFCVLGAILCVQGTVLCVRGAALCVREAVLCFQGAVQCVWGAIHCVQKAILCSQRAVLCSWSPGATAKTYPGQWNKHAGDNGKKLTRDNCRNQPGTMQQTCWGQ